MTGDDPALAAWAAAWAALGVTPSADLLAALRARYAEPARAYHTAQHLGECFTALAPAAALAERLPEVQLALWFHDAIYDARAHDNEARSAEWAEAVLRAAGLGAPAAGRIHALVMATTHAAEPTDADARLLVDVDLAILGAEPARFAEYERQIRVEYGWVPEAEYRARRARVLGRFLARPRLYGTDWFADRLEARARANLARSLEGLRVATVPTRSPHD